MDLTAPTPSQTVDHFPENGANWVHYEGPL